MYTLSVTQYLFNFVELYRVEILKSTSNHDKIIMLYAGTMEILIYHFI